ncbi:MAG: molecular chaperone TorD family protein [Gordonibacter pamelaeae]
MDEDDVRRAIGLADSCELMAAAFAFPDAELAAALADGSFQSDALACLADAGAATATVDKAAAALSAFDGADVVGLADRMRKGHTILYLTPGVDVPIWPYEASFRYTAEGHEGSPALFRSARTLDVERHMREAGVLPKTARKEPSDSVWNEFSFLSFLRQPCRRRTGRSPRRRCGMERTCRPFLG